MTRLPPICDQRFVQYPERHLLAIEGLHPPAIAQLLDLAESYVLLNRSGKTQRDLLRGKTLINLFFEDSTRTRTSFELAGKRLGADVINMSVSTSSVNKGETLLDTAATLNAMQCDLLVVRHDQSGAPNLLAQKVDAAVINAGDGTHEHPTQALLDALTIRRRKGRLEGLTIAICGDIGHSRVARSNIHLLTTMGSRVRVIGPPTLIPAEAARLGVEIFHDMREGLAGADIVMLDNYATPAALIADAQHLKALHPHVLVEASGGIGRAALPDYFSPAVDVVSMGALTAGYPIVDFSLKVDHDAYDAAAVAAHPHVA